VTSLECGIDDAGSTEEGKEFRKLEYAAQRTEEIKQECVTERGNDCLLMKTPRIIRGLSDEKIRVLARIL
jgi:hypothetical protein